MKTLHLINLAADAKEGKRLIGSQEDLVIVKDYITKFGGASTLSKRGLTITKSIITHSVNKFMEAL